MDSNVEKKINAMELDLDAINSDIADIKTAIENLSSVADESRAYDDVNDGVKVISHGVNYKLIALDSITGIVNGDDGSSGWIDDDDIKRAKAFSLYYTASQTHNFTMKFDPNNPATIGYFGATTNAPFHSGSIGGLGSISQKFTSEINDGNLNFYWNNQSGGATMDITNIVLRLQF
jgi:hypothetical protein